MALIKCSECGNEVSSRALSCPKCGCPITSPAKEDPQSASSGPEMPPNGQKKLDETLGTILIMIPLAAAALAYFWVGSMRMIDGPGSKLGLLMALTVLGTAGLVTVEAQRLGFGSDPNAPRSERDSPIVWFFGMVLVWAIAYPRYLYLRSRRGARNLLVAGLVSLSIWIVAFGYVGTSIIQGHETIQRTFEQLQGGSQGGTGQDPHSDQGSICTSNMFRLYGSAQGWAVESVKMNTFPQLNEVTAYIVQEEGGKVPICPAGGQYSFDRWLPRCSIHGLYQPPPGL